MSDSIPLLEFQDYLPLKNWLKKLQTETSTCQIVSFN